MDRAEQLMFRYNELNTLIKVLEDTLLVDDIPINTKFKLMDELVCISIEADCEYNNRKPLGFTKRCIMSFTNKRMYPVYSFLVRRGFFA